MHTYVATTTPATPVAEAAAGMVAANVGSAVVMQGPFLAGILTERDALLGPPRPERTCRHRRCRPG